MVLQASTDVQPTDCNDIGLARYLHTGPDQHQSAVYLKLFMSTLQAH